MKHSSLFPAATLAASLALGCASSPPPAAETAPATKASSSSPAPVNLSGDTPGGLPCDAEAAPAESLEMVYALPDSEKWTEVSKHDSGLSGWTPDHVIRNEELGATIAFLGIPKTFGSTSMVAENAREKFEGSSIVMAEVSGKKASFTFCHKPKDKKKPSRCGKVFVINTGPAASEYVMVVGVWPEASNETATRDINMIATTFRGLPSK